MIGKASLIFVLFAYSLPAQSTATVKGNCNATASGSNITVTVKCDASLSKQAAESLAKQYAEILKRIQQEHIAFDVVIEKLDSIQQGVDDLESSNAPRRLTESEIAELKDLATKLPTDSLMLVYLNQDQEAISYASEFNRGLGLKYPYLISVGMMTPHPVGIEVAIPSAYARTGRQPEACRLIRSFLDKEEILYKQTVGGWSPIGDAFERCTLIIGTKPI